MQLTGLTLASKQPAMTAAALGAALEHHDRLDEQVEVVAAITRSQTIATLGNVLATIPMALLVDWTWHLVRGRYLLDTVTAEHGIHALHPLLSLTVPFAVLTGVFLWLSSLAAGWTANWAAYRRLPEALSRHRRLRRLFGERRAARFGGWVDRNLGGIVGYLCLGFLLGFMPLVFAFMGLGIEVRHVTLSAASLALTFLPLAAAGILHWQEVAWGLLSIGLIGICNFGVSFTLALRTAMQARDLGATERALLGRALRDAFRKQPSRFLWIPRGSAESQPGSSPRDATE
jgi:site-specific recombinase